MLAELHEKLFDWKEQLLPKHPMAEAVNYALGHWEELNVFLSDGAVPIDNNVATAARGSGDIMPTAGLCRVRQSEVMIYGELGAITGSDVGIITGFPRRRGGGPEAGIGLA